MSTTHTTRVLDADEHYKAAAVSAEVAHRFGRRRATPAGRVRTVPGAFHVPLMMTAGVVDDDARQTFTRGQCHALAFAVNLRTGWPVAYVGSPECIYDSDCRATTETLGWCNCQVDHLGVLSPAGHFVDIAGHHTVEQVVATWVEDTYWQPWADDAPAGQRDRLRWRREAVGVMDTAMLEYVLTCGHYRAPEISLALSVATAVAAAA